MAPQTAPTTFPYGAPRVSSGAHLRDVWRLLILLERHPRFVRRQHGFHSAPVIRHNGAPHGSRPEGVLHTGPDGNRNDAEGARRDARYLASHGAALLRPRRSQSIHREARSSGASSRSRARNRDCPARRRHAPVARSGSAPASSGCSCSHCGSACATACTSAAGGQRGRRRGVCCGRGDRREARRGTPDLARRLLARERDRRRHRVRGARPASPARDPCRPVSGEEQREIAAQRLLATTGAPCRSRKRRLLACELAPVPRRRREA